MMRTLVYGVAWIWGSELLGIGALVCFAAARRSFRSIRSRIPRGK